MDSDQSLRLARVARKQTVVLTHYGRKTGKPHNVTIWFVVHGDKVILSTANIGRQWVRNVLKTPQVKLSIGGEVFEGTARFLVDPAELKAALAIVYRKYWVFRPMVALWELLQAIGLVRDARGAFEVTLVSA